MGRGREWLTEYIPLTLPVTSDRMVRDGGNIKRKVNAMTENFTGSRFNISNRIDKCGEGKIKQKGSRKLERKNRIPIKQPIKRKKKTTNKINRDI